MTADDTLEPHHLRLLTLACEKESRRELGSEEPERLSVAVPGPLHDVGVHALIRCVGDMGRPRLLWVCDPPATFNLW